MTHRDRLESVGFRKHAEWRLDGDRLSLAIETTPPGDRLLYAFVAGEELLYLGKTTRGLRKRLAGYRTPGKTQRTNVRVSAELTKRLRIDESIQVYAWACDGLMTYGGFRINLAAAIEDAILRELRPVWNIRT